MDRIRETKKVQNIKEKLDQTSSDLNIDHELNKKIKSLEDNIVKMDHPSFEEQENK